MNEKINEVILEQWNRTTPLVRVSRVYRCRDYFPSWHSLERINRMVGDELVVTSVYIGVRGIIVTLDVNI